MADIGDTLLASRYGVVVGIFPASPAFPIRVRRAPDNGAGGPNLAQIDSFELPAGTQSYTDRLPNDRIRRHYSFAHVREGYETSEYTCWKGAVPVLLPDVSPAPLPVAPQFTEVIAEQGAQGSLTLTQNDPQCRLFRIEFRSRSGLEEWSAWRQSFAPPHTEFVQLVEKHVSRIAYRVTFYDADGALREVEDEVVFGVGSVPVPPSSKVSYNGTQATVITIGDSDTSTLWVEELVSSDPADPRVVPEELQATAGRFAVSRKGAFIVEAHPDRTRRLFVYAKNAAGTAGEREEVVVNRLAETQVLLRIEAFEAALTPGAEPVGIVRVNYSDPGQEVDYVKFYLTEAGGARDVEPRSPDGSYSWGIDKYVQLHDKHNSIVEPVIYLKGGGTIQPGPITFDIDKTANVTEIVVAANQGNFLALVSVDSDSAGVGYQEWLGYWTAAQAALAPEANSTAWRIPITASLSSVRRFRVYGINTSGQAGPPKEFSVDKYEPVVDWSITVSETATAGTLSMKLVGASGYVSAVQMYRQSGQEPKEGFVIAPDANGLYTLSVALHPLHNSSIEPVIVLQDARELRPGAETFDTAETANIIGVAVAASRNIAKVRIQADTDTKGGIFIQEWNGAQWTGEEMVGQPSQREADFERVMYANAQRTWRAYGRNSVGVDGPFWPFQFDKYVPEKPIVKVASREFYDPNRGKYQAECAVSLSDPDAQVAGVRFYVQVHGEARQGPFGPSVASGGWFYLFADLHPSRDLFVEPEVVLVDGDVIRPGGESYDSDKTAEITSVNVAYNNNRGLLRFKGDSDTVQGEWMEVSDEGAPLTGWVGPITNFDPASHEGTVGDYPGNPDGFDQGASKRYFRLRGLNDQGVAGPYITAVLEVTNSGGAGGGGNPPLPQLSSFDVQTMDNGFCSSEGSGDVTNYISWSCANAPDSAYSMRLSRSNDGGVSWATYWENGLSNPVSTHNGWDLGTNSLMYDLFPRARRLSGGGSYMYRVQLIRRSDGAEIASSTSGVVPTSVFYCPGGGAV